jgi:membrane protease YdiL (CAAX protease family)
MEVLSQRETPSPAEPQPAGDVQETRALWLEVAAVLLIGVVPDLWATVTNLIWPETLLRWPVVPESAYLILRSLEVGGLTLYLIARSGTPWSEFGIVAPRWVADPLWSMVALIASYFAYAFYAAGAAALVPAEALTREWERLAGLFPPPSGPGAAALVVLSSVANGFAEELVMRGYLIPRFERLLGSSVVAVLLTSVLFASYHLYQGTFGAGSALVHGLVAGALFCWTRRLWPIAAAHALWDIESLLG